MRETIANINSLYRLLDCLNILFPPDNPLRMNLVHEINAMLDDLERDCNRDESDLPLD